MGAPTRDTSSSQITWKFGLKILVRGSPWPVVLIFVLFKPLNMKIAFIAMFLIFRHIVVRAIPAVGCVRVRVVCWVGNGSRDLPKGSSMGATLAFRRTGMCIAPPTWHMRCAAWYYKYRCMLFCNPPSRESGTLVITESFGLRHQEEPCACGEPRVSQDNNMSHSKLSPKTASEDCMLFFFKS